MPELSAVCEAQGCIIYFYRGPGLKAFEHLVERLLVFSRDQLFGQPRPPLVKLRAPLFDGARQYAPFELEYVKAEARFYDGTHVAGAQRLDRPLKHSGQLAFVVTVQPATVGVRRVGMEASDGRKIAPAFGHFKVKTLGLFFRLHADFSRVEARALGQARLILLYVTLNLFGRDPHVALQDLAIILLHEQVRGKLFARVRSRRAAFQLRILLRGLLYLAFGDGKPGSRGLVKHEVTAQVLVKQLAFERVRSVRARKLAHLKREETLERRAAYFAFVYCSDDRRKIFPARAAESACRNHQAEQEYESMSLHFFLFCHREIERKK